uniref:PGG domain-containing protein n=1 Tax=Triticum aestivum TaxID=4565 RepID=A0A077RZJ1_WHEAT|nr:unnamed protein product [Triticum aestivum]
MTPPGGVWHDPIMRSTHYRRYVLFFYFNAAAIALSLMVVILTLVLTACPKNSRSKFSTDLLLGLLMLMATLAFMVAYCTGACPDKFRLVVFYVMVSIILVNVMLQSLIFICIPEEDSESDYRKLLAPLTMFLTAIAYVAGLSTPGGFWDSAEGGHHPGDAVWQDGHMAGDPILLSTNAGRYKAFFYCNTVAFAASFLAIFLAQKSYLNEHHALQAAMILYLLGLIVAYAIGSCRDQISSMYAVGIAGAAVVYVVVHVQYFTLGSEDEAPVVLKKIKDDALVDKKGHRFLLFAILVASITYQAGLTPPGGFLLQDDIQSGHRAGDPVLLYNYPRRYKVFFYCNSPMLWAGVGVADTPSVVDEAGGMGDRGLPGLGDTGDRGDPRVGVEGDTVLPLACGLEALPESSSCSPGPVV